MPGVSCFDSVSRDFIRREAWSGKCKQVCRGVRGPLCLALAEANPDGPIAAIIDLGLRLARASFYGKATGTLSMQESAIIAGQLDISLGKYWE